MQTASDSRTVHGRSISPRHQFGKVAKTGTKGLGGGWRWRVAAGAALVTVALGGWASWAALTADYQMPGTLSVQFVSQRAGWAVTPGHLWRTADGGSTWVSMPTPPDFEGRIDPVAVLSDSTAVVCTMAGGRWHVYSTQDAGIRWAVTGKLPVPAIPGAPPVPESSTGGTFVQFVTPQVGWIVTSIGGAAGSERIDLAHTADGGAHWTYTWWPSPPSVTLGGGGGDITGIQFLSPQLGFLTGARLLLGAPFLVRWIGGTGPGNEPAVPHAFASTELEVSAPLRTGTGRLLLPVMATPGGYLAESANDGDTWHVVGILPQAIAAFGQSPLRAALRGSADLWIAQGRDIWVSNQGGRDWHLVQHLPSSEVVSGLASAGSQIAWVPVALDNRSGMPIRPVALLRTTNAGRTWQHVTVP